MKKLIFKLILPIAIVSFGVFTKWWFVHKDDAPQTMYSGFPLPFVGNAWHTSGALQIFVAEFFFDFLIYFTIWLLIFYCFNRYVKPINLHKVVPIVLWFFVILILLFTGIIASDPNHIFYAKQPHPYKVLETGYRFTWQNTPWPN